MIKFFEITVSNAGDQNLLLDKIKSSGGSAIQTSRGLVAKLEASEAAALCGQLPFREIASDEIASCADDVRAFLSG